MKYALSVHLRLGTIVIGPIAIASLRHMAPQQGTVHDPETAQHPNPAASSTSTRVSRFVYTFHFANWTLSVQKIEHHALLLF